MNYDFSKRVWATNLKGGKLLVMLALAQHADPKGECYPSADTLAAMARLTDRQVRRVINALEKSGHIAIEQRAIGRGKKPAYRLFPCENADKMSTFSTEEDTMSDLKAEEMSAIEKESGQNVHLNGTEPIKADISDTKSGHFATVKADISAPIQSHARSEHHLEHQENLTEEEQTHARDPLAVAWQQVYADEEIPAHLVKPFEKLVKETTVAACIHGIKAGAANPDARNFSYIAECARNYVPPAPLASYASEPGYAVDLPGIVPMPATNGHAPPLPAPMPHDDPWAVAVAELMPAFAHNSAGRWLVNSRLEYGGDIAGQPLYRVLLTEPGANAQWMTQQAEPAIRKKLANLLGKRVSIAIEERNQP